MLEKLVKVWEKWSKEGMQWPFVHDPVKNKPSVTLLFFYIAFCISTGTTIASSTLMLIKGEYFTATIMPMLTWFTAFVFYRLRRLDSVKIDLDDKSISLEGGENEEK